MDITCKKCGHQFKGDNQAPKAIQYQQCRQVFRLPTPAMPKCPQCGHRPLPPKRSKSQTQAKPWRELKTMGDVSAKTEVSKVTSDTSLTDTGLDIVSARTLLGGNDKTELAMKLEPVENQQATVQAESNQERVTFTVEPDDFSELDLDIKFDPKPLPVEPTSVKTELKDFDESGGSRSSISGLISVGVATLILGVGIYRTAMQNFSSPHYLPASYIQEASFAPSEEAAPRVDTGYDSGTAILSPSVRASEGQDESWLDYVHRHMGEEEQYRNLFPRRARMSSDFGYRVDPFTKAWKFHHGLDIAMKHGTKVRAFLPGKVIVAGHRRGYGRVVMVEHEHGLVTVFGHLSKVMVDEGDRVAPYQPLGRVGMTGRATGPHLHLEVQLNGKKIDPNVIPQLAHLTKKKKKSKKRKS